MRNVIAYCLLIASASWLVFQFAVVLATGEYLLYEPNKGILISEIVLFSLGTALGVERFLSLGRRH